MIIIAIAIITILFYIFTVSIYRAMSLLYLGSVNYCYATMLNHI